MNKRIYLPKNLDLDGDIEIYGDKLLKRHKDKIKHLIHVLYITPLINRKYFKKMSNTGKRSSRNVFIPISGKRLQYLYGERYAKPIIEFARKSGYIESNGYYEMGKIPICYRLARHLRNQEFRKDFISNDDLIGKLERDDTLVEMSPLNQMFLTNLKKLEFDFAAANKFVYESWIAKEEWCDAIHKYTARKLMIDMWENEGVRLIEDGKAKRIHTNITNLASELRQFLTWHGIKLQGIDIRNSQPYFFIYQILEFYKSNHTDTIPTDIFDTTKLINHINTSISTHLPHIMQPLEHSPYDMTVLPYDVQNYIYLTVTGDLYDYLKEEKIRYWKYTKRNKKETRKSAKENIFTIFYQKEDSERSSVAKEIFKIVFPNVFRVIELSKIKDHRKFSIGLQRIESDMVLRTICKRIFDEKPEIPLFTIHDSILSTPDNIEYIKRIMNEELYKKIAILPELKVEDYI